MCAGALIVSDERLLENSSRIISCWLKMLKGWCEEKEWNQQQANQFKSNKITRYIFNFMSRTISIISHMFSHALIQSPFKKRAREKTLSLHPSLEIYSRLFFNPFNTFVGGCSSVVGGRRRGRIEIEHRVYDWLVVKIEKSSHCFGASWLSRVMWFILHGKWPNFISTPIHWCTLESSSC